MKLEFHWNASSKEILESATGGSRTKLFVANEAKRLMDPYVPFLNGPLHTNVSVGVDEKGGYVHYKEPYAQFQFHGEVMLGVNSHSPYANYGEKKETTSRELKYNRHRHPLATSHWDEAMKKAHLSDLTNATQKFIRNGG